MKEQTSLKKHLPSECLLHTLFVSVSQTWLSQQLQTLIYLTSSCFWFPLFTTNLFYSCSCKQAFHWLATR